MARDGFKFGNGPGTDKGIMYGTNNADQIKGTRLADTIDGLAGDDVIIGYAGDDTLEGGTGADDLSGGTGNDRLVGAVWNADADGNTNIDIGHWTQTAGAGTPETNDDVWTFTREFTQDGQADDYVAAGSFAENGTDTIYGYDQAHDVIEVKALLTAVNTIAQQLDLADDGFANGTKTAADVTAQDLIAGGYVALEGGHLKINLSGGGATDSWFDVKVDNSDTANGATTTTNPGADPAWADATQVTIEVGTYHFVIDSQSFG